MNVGAGAANAHYHAQIEALKAVATLVQLDEETFRLVLRSREHPTIIAATTGFWRFKGFVYLTTFDGFTFVLKSDTELDLEADAPGAFFIRAQKVTIPFL